MYIEKYDLHVRFQPMNVHVRDSYKLTYRAEVWDAINIIKDTKRGSRYRRSAKSWNREWVAHNWLYWHNLFVSHTESVDLNDDEPFWKRLCYFIIYVISFL